MFRFEREQLVFDIGGVRVGGQPGENPTVVIGSIFYKGDKVVLDERSGKVDREAAEGLIRRFEEISDRTGLPCMLDVVCTNAENARRYLEFVVDVTKMPILIDFTTDEAAISGMEVAKELGVLDRVVLNSLTPETREVIFQKAKEVGIRAAIALTYSSRAIISYRERIRILDTLIPKIKSAGIDKILVDTCVLDIATLGLACRAIYEVKRRYGYPCGCGAHNAVASWKQLLEKKNKILTVACTAIANGLPIAIGADFILFGPVSDAEFIVPAIAVINAAYGQVLMEEGRRPRPDHPRFKISRL